MARQLVRYLSIKEAIKVEIKDTLECNTQSYVQWSDLSDKKINKHKVKFIVTSDMVWQKRSPGFRYDSSSGHAFIVDGISQGVIGIVLY